MDQRRFAVCLCALLLACSQARYFPDGPRDFHCAAGQKVRIVFAERGRIAEIGVGDDDPLRLEWTGTDVVAEIYEGAGYRLKIDPEASLVRQGVLVFGPCQA